MFGNLGRAQYSRSTNGIWPFNFDQRTESTEDCTVNQCRAQRISANDGDPPFGLNPYQGRGAPEIDVLEVQPGGHHNYYDEKHTCKYNCSVQNPDTATRLAASYRNPIVSTSLQAAPGFLKDADQRPVQGCVPDIVNVSNIWRRQWYQPELNLFNYGSAKCTQRCYKVTPNYFFYGLPLELDTSTFKDTGWGTAAHEVLHTDAYSANTELSESHFDSFHTYRVEWDPDPEHGYVRWSLDGVVQFQLEASLLTTPRSVSVHGTVLGELKPKMVPNEAMYLLLNVDASPKWGWPNTPNSLECNDDGDKKRATNTKYQWYTKLCKMLPGLAFEVDWVRVYQPVEPKGTYNVGCSPDKLPTRRWIAAHADEYKFPAPIANVTLIKVLPGGGGCSNDAACNGPAGGHCTSQACMCLANWTGPHCRSQSGPVERSCEAYENMAPATSCPVPKAYPLSRLTVLMDLICNASITSNPQSNASSFCSNELNYGYWMDCARLKNTSAHSDYSAWSACVDLLTDCNSRQLTAALLAQRQLDDPSTCTNTFYRDDIGEAHLVDSQVTADSARGLWPNLDPAVRGVHYAPFIPGAASADQLYDDANYEVFVRDMSLLHDLEATTLVLEPLSSVQAAQVQSGQLLGERQALFNATNFNATSARSVIDKHNEAVRKSWTALRVVPSLDLGPVSSGGFIKLTVPTPPSGGRRMQGDPAAESTTLSHVLSEPSELGVGNSQGNSQEVLKGTPQKQSPKHVTDYDAAVAETMDYICATTNAFVRQTLTPAANTSMDNNGNSYGGGHHGSKDNVQAIELHLVPNDGGRWISDGGLRVWLDWQQKPKWNLFKITEHAAKCAQDTQNSLLGQGVLRGLPRPVLVTLKDNVCANGGDELVSGTMEDDDSAYCVSAAGFVELYRKYKLTHMYGPVVDSERPWLAPQVDGFLVRTERARGCNAKQVANQVARQAVKYRSDFGKPSLVWFSVGVDEYDTLQSSTYPAAVYTNRPNDDFLPLSIDSAASAPTDARTECLLGLISSIDAGCDAEPTSLRCGLVVQEYADSNWRALSGASPAESVSSDVSVLCAETAAGSSARAALAAEKQLPCGSYVPCVAGSPDCRETNASGVHAMHASAVSLLDHGRLPQRILCNPYVVATTPLSAQDAWALPPCAHEEKLRIDEWHNPAYDGLLTQPSEDVRNWHCNPLFQKVSYTLQPRRAYYALRAAWAHDNVARTDSSLRVHARQRSDLPTVSNVTVASEWRIATDWYKLAEKNNSKEDAKFGVVLLWLVLVCVVFVCLRGVLGVFGGVSGRASSLIAMVLVLGLNQINIGPLQLPSGVASTLNQLTADLLLLLLWTPLNGGAGDGNWWWVHFSLFAQVWTSWAAVPEYEFQSYFTLFFEYLVKTARSIVDPAYATAPPPAKTPPWDPCRSDLCCVRKGNGGIGTADVAAEAFYFPWASNVTVPHWWDPYLPWADVHELLIFSGLVAIFLLILLFFIMQLLYCAFVYHTDRRAYQILRNPKMRQPSPLLTRRFRIQLPVNEGSQALHTSSGVYADVDKAVEHLSDHFGEHFQRTAIDAVKQQLKGLIESRARRTQGYAARVAPRLKSGETIAAVLDVAVKALEPPETIAHADTAAVWFELTDNLRTWLELVAHRELRRRSVASKQESLFTSIADLLIEFGGEMKKEVRGLAKSAHQKGITPAHWEVVILLLLVGSDNFFRVSPEVINMLFSVYFCQWKHGKVSLDDLSNLHSAIYELQRHAGGKLGNRLADTMSEKYMNFDDLGDLCTRQGGCQLFNGLEALAFKMKDETRSLLKNAEGLTDELVDANSRLRTAHGLLLASYSIDEHLSRLPDTQAHDLRLSMLGRNAFFHSTSQIADSILHTRSQRVKGSRVDPMNTGLMTDDGAHQAGVEMDAFCVSQACSSDPSQLSSSGLSGPSSSGHSGDRATDTVHVEVMEGKVTFETPYGAKADSRDYNVNNADPSHIVGHLLEDHIQAINTFRSQLRATYSAGAFPDHQDNSARDSTREQLLPSGDPQPALEHRQMLLSDYAELVRLLVKNNLGSIVTAVEGIKNAYDADVEQQHAKVLLDKVSKLINVACDGLDQEGDGEHSLQKKSLMQKKLIDIKQGLNELEADRKPKDLMLKLAVLNGNARDAVKKLTGESAPAYIAVTTSPIRFTWGHDEHKTFEERPGYLILLQNTWFLWKMMILLLLTMVVYESGGYPVFALFSCSFESDALSMALKKLDDGLLKTRSSVVGTTLGDWLRRRFQGYAPFYLAGYLSLAIASVALQAINDILILVRALTVDSQREHSKWDLIDHITLKASNVRSWSSQWYTNNSDESSAVRGSDGCASDCKEVPRRTFKEAAQILIMPIAMVVYLIASIVSSLFCGVLWLYTFRGYCSQRFVLASLRLLLRLVWLFLMLAACFEIKQDAKNAFLFLGFLQGWFDIALSLMGTYFAHKAPGDEVIPGLFAQARTFFGWWYHWVEPGAQYSMPRDSRTYKQLIVSSLFWVLVFFLKTIIELSAVSNLVRAMFTICTLYSDLVASNAAWLQLLVVVIVGVLRVAFSVLFFIADLQLFFATGMAIAGSVQRSKRASLVSTRSLREYWDRTVGGLTKAHLEAATKGVLRRMPLAIGLLCEPLETRSSSTFARQPLQQNKSGLDAMLMRCLWNYGLLRDLRDSHLITAKQEAQLRIDIDNDGVPTMPDLSRLASSLCFGARRRIHSFLSYCARIDTPVPALPSHSPSLTVLVPVYGETIVRSWPDMFKEQLVGVGVVEGQSTSLTSFEYMVERQMSEFRCLLETMTDSERAVLAPFLEVPEQEAVPNMVALADVSQLRDALWYSDYLLIYVKTRSALPQTEKQVPDAVQAMHEAARICQLILKCAVAKTASIGGGQEIVPGPSAERSANRTTLNELESRMRICEQIIALEVTNIDQVVEKLYLLPPEYQGEEWNAMRSTLMELEPAGMDEQKCDAVLSALGVSVHGWSPSEMCTELWRTLNESRVKLKLRLWFSSREQTVWRTLTGLVKVMPALTLLQSLGAVSLQNAQSHVNQQLASEQAGASEEISAVQAPAAAAAAADLPADLGALPPSLYTVMAALQNYGGWQDNKSKLLKDGEGLLARWEGGEGPIASKLSNLLFGLGDNSLTSIFDQCLSVSLLLKRCAGMKLACLPKGSEGETKGKTLSKLCRGGNMRLPLTGEDARRLEGRKEVSLMPDPNGEYALLEEERVITLPGNPIVDGLAEGKPINQANALLHCTSELVMVNDMNQGADLEQWFFLPQLLAEFHTDGQGREKPDSTRVIVGFKEQIFTEGDGLVGRSGALNEFTFGTIIQRELHVTLNARLHYGHPDIFKFPFVLTNGGTSKCSKTVHVSEDIFGGINVLSRGGTVHYADYIQVDKGRDVQYDAALGFEGKISGGTAVHTLSRDFYRLMSSPLTFFHRVSLFSGAFGYFWSNMMLAMAVLNLAALHGTAAMLPDDTQFLIFRDTPSYVPLVNLGFVYLLALAVQYMKERGFKPTLSAVLTVVVAIPLTLAKLKTHQYYAHRGLALGLAKYVPTGRSLATKRVGFKQYFERYSISHFAPALDLAVLLLVTARFSALGHGFYVRSTVSLWLVACSWLLAPALYNPFAFTLTGLQADRTEWAAWLHSEAFEDWFFGQKAGSATGELNQNNWYSWLNAEPTHLKLLHAIARLFIYGTIAILALQRSVYSPVVEVDTIRIPSSQWWIELVEVVLFLCVALYASRLDRGVLRTMISYAILIFVILPFFVLDGWNVLDVLFLLVLCLYVIGKAASAALELCPASSAQPRTHP